MEGNAIFMEKESENHKKVNSTLNWLMGIMRLLLNYKHLRIVTVGIYIKTLSYNLNKN